MNIPQFDATASGSVVAFRSVRAGKNVFMLLVGLAVLGQLGAFVLVHFVGVIDPVSTVVVSPPAAEAEKQITAAPASQPAKGQVKPPSQGRFEAVRETTFWGELLKWALPGLRFMALVAGLLAVLTLMFAVKLSLVGRLRGIAPFMSAFFWSLILLAMITPWQQILRGAFASGALYNLGELTRHVSRIKSSWGATDVRMLDLVFYYARFMAYPIVVLLVWMIVMTKFARGYRESIMGPVGTIPDERPGGPVGMA